MGRLLKPIDRQRLSVWLSYGEDTIYLVAGGILAATAGLMLFSTGKLFFQAVLAETLVRSSLEVLDSLLLVLMLVELLHTIRVSIVEHTLVTEPFLIIALIAGVRRILILTAEASQFIQTQPERFRMAMIEIGVLTVFFLVIVGCIVLLRRFSSNSSGA
jgi:uncharacterized membrane protein (DUF373 family)